MTYNPMNIQHDKLKCQSSHPLEIRVNSEVVASGMVRSLQIHYSHYECGREGVDCLCPLPLIHLEGILEFSEDRKLLEAEND